jgi:bifunctional DNase/RNase
VEKIKLEILGLSSSQSQTGSFALVLGEEQGRRRLPIIIGIFEAQSIAIEIEKITADRPMTHDLFKLFAQNFDFTVEEVLVSELKEGVFYAKIVCSSNKGVRRVEIDSRPSDAIAIGLRFGVPIYTYESILSEAGIDVIEEVAADKETTVPVQTTGTEIRSLADFPLDELKIMLDQALADEDYERAATIRDILNKK